MLTRRARLLICLFVAALLVLPMPVLALGPKPPIVKGVALLDWSHPEDLAMLNAPQFYGWGQYCRALQNCTNMVREWQLPVVCPASGNLLVGNEPNVPEPAGHPISAMEAATRTLAIQAMCSATRLIVANIYLNNFPGDYPDALGWLTDYLADYQFVSGHSFTQTIGLHDYAWDADRGKQYLQRIENGLASYGGQFWITEFRIYGDVAGCQCDQLTPFLKWLGWDTRIERVYIWTNRMSGYLNLVNADGTLTPDGAMYAAWQPPSVWQSWLPGVDNGGKAGYP